MVSAWMLPGALSVIAAGTLAILLLLGRFSRGMLGERGAGVELSSARWELSLVFLSTALVHGAHAVGLATECGAMALGAALAGSALQAMLLAAFAKALIWEVEKASVRQNPRGMVARRTTAGGGGGIPSRVRAALLAVALATLVALALLVPAGPAVPAGLVERGSSGERLLTVGFRGQLACAGVLLAVLLASARLEELWRRARQPLRYQLKFSLLGLALLPLTSLYVTSSFLLQGRWFSELAVAHSSVTALGLALSAAGLLRLRQPADWRGLLDPEAANRSVSLGLAGVFLMVLGAAAAVLPRGATLSEYVLGITLLAATGVALTALMASRYVRTVLGRFFARTFRRSKYDYRSKWLEVVEAFHGVTSTDAILDRLVRLLGQTFSAARMSVWLQSGADRRFHQVRSVNVEPAPPPLEMSHPLIVAATASPEVRRLEDLGMPQDDEFCQATRARVVAPIWSGSLLGLVVLSDDLLQAPYDQDDVDLLHAISSHAGLLLAHVALLARQQAGAEARALHDVSLFCIHDLKNLAGRLSLVAQNAKRFGDDPEFQKSALRTVSSTVHRMTALIERLSTRGELTPDSGPGGEDADLFQALGAATQTTKDGVKVHAPDAPCQRSRVGMSQAALDAVLLNLVTNAEQALGAGGEIAIEATEREGQWQVTIRDDGEGIDPRSLATLFEPFHSTKRTGLGVGLYQCRRILEAAGGSILVESEVGVGTSVRLTLPAVTPGAKRPLQWSQRTA